MSDAELAVVSVKLEGIGEDLSDIKGTVEDLERAILGKPGGRSGLQARVEANEKDIGYLKRKASPTPTRVEAPDERTDPRATVPDAPDSKLHATRWNVFGAIAIALISAGSGVALALLTQ